MAAGSDAADVVHVARMPGRPGNPALRSPATSVRVAPGVREESLLGCGVVTHGDLRPEHAGALLVGEPAVDAVVRGLRQAVRHGRVLPRRPRQVPAVEQLVAERDAEGRT